VNEAKLKKLLEIFQESDVEELELQHSFWRGTRIRISRRLQPEVSTPALPQAPPRTSVPRHAPAASENPPAAAPSEEDLHVIAAPMVGTFFRSSSPDTEPFVQMGDRVKPGQVVCIIEAMKIMNEISADVEGEIVEILVDSASPVEFDQPLLKIRPS
jgi:acetyl-CoA carboxylase biotin carboxyl carrier protein